MIVYMTHPVHGAMHVYSEQEVTANEANGWKRAEVDPISHDVVPEPDPIPQFVPRRGPGRPRKDA